MYFPHHLQNENVSSGKRRVAPRASLVRRALAAGTAGCVALCGNNRIPDSFLPVAYILEECARREKKTLVKLCQCMNPSSVCLPRCCVSFVSGLIVAREEFLHLPTHAYTHGLYISDPRRGFFSLFVCLWVCHFYRQTPSHADLLCATINHKLCAVRWWLWLDIFVLVNQGAAISSPPVWFIWNWNCACCLDCAAVSHVGADE